MQSKLTATELRQGFLNVADVIISSEARLNLLDAAVGDGDHGITMRHGFEAIKNRLAALDASAGLSEVLIESGKAFMAATGGAIGIIFGRSLVSAGTALRDAQEFATPELKVMLAAMEASIVQTGKAKPGDKTILDAVHAARGAAEQCDHDNQSLGEALDSVAAAAARAAQKTTEMVGRAGRASRLGERTLGHQDPGAASFAVIMRAFHEWVAA
jgi:dihydroxyacetone kinase-like protein